MADQRQGGFLQPLLSPPLTAETSSTVDAPTLPHPRAHPLKPGGSKESSFIRFVDESIMQIQRRYANRGSEELGLHDAPGAEGYKSFVEVAQDMDRLVDLIWVSGTPSVEVPYLLTLAVLSTQYLPSFPPAPRATFRILGKFDLAFASLLQGRNVETGEQLPGFAGGRGISGTEKVRIKSVVDRTRVIVTEVMEGKDVDEVEEEEEDDDDDDYDDDCELHMEDDGDVSTDVVDRQMGVAKVYDRCVVELGDSLGGTPRMVDSLSATPIYDQT